MSHANKQIRKAIAFAEAHGWRFQKSGPRAHIFGQLLCPHGCRCIKRIFSTPRDAENHAHWIIREVRKCPR